MGSKGVRQVAKHISIAGKGGTGKTTLAALLIRFLCERGKTPILAIDADPNSNLGEALGMKVKGTVADILADVKNPRAVPPGMSKHSFIEYRLNTALTESPKVDLLTMGGPEGPGCYCAPNDILRGYIGKLKDNYPYMVMDNEAGLEHLSRRIAQDVDIMIITTDPTVRGVRSAGRIAQLVRSLKLDYRKLSMVMCMASEEQAEGLRREIEETGVELGGVVPRDPMIEELDLEGRPLIELLESSPAYRAVCEIAERLGI